MFGGLKKSASRMAIVAAAGTMMTGTAFAADLGGDCCADLEERVAELEATTARKGNRKVSLTISGQVNRTMMYWNDGGRSNTYFGLDNTNTSSRFALTGSAKITPTFSAGYNILIEMSDKGRSIQTGQRSEDGNSKFAAPNSAGGDHALAARDVNVWLESSQLGRLTVGRLTGSGPVGVIDLGGISVVAPAAVLTGSGLALRDSATGKLTSFALSGVTDANGDFGQRQEGIKYTTPTFAGFVANASIGEAMKIVNGSVQDNLLTAPTLGGVAAGRDSFNGQVYGANLLYAGEFSGVRVAAGIGYERFELDGTLATSGSTGFGARVQQWGGSLAALHVPTGLFLQGDYISTKRAAVFDYSIAGGALYNADVSASRYIIQGGVTQNFFGPGKTSLFGEYGKYSGWAQALNQDATANVGAIAATTVAAAGGDAMFFGLGAVQNFDAAALELYAGWRRYSVGDITGRAVLGNGGVTATPVVTGTAAAPATFSIKDIDVVTAGARIKF